MKTFKFDGTGIIRVQATTEPEAMQIVLDQIQVQMLKNGLPEALDSSTDRGEAQLFIEGILELELEMAGEAAPVLRELIEEVGNPTVAIDMEWIDAAGHRYYEATAGGNIYGDSDGTDQLTQGLMEIFGLEYDEDED